MLPGLGPVEALLKRLTPTAQLKLFGLMKIPLLFLVSPKVLRLDEDICEVKVPLNYMTRNHVGSMYFGTLAIGADCVVAVHALHVASQMKSVHVVPIFKDLHVDFFKRAEADVVFKCSAGKEIKQMIEKGLASGERVTQSVVVEAFANISGAPEVVAKFSLGLSLRVKKST